VNNLAGLFGSGSRYLETVARPPAEDLNKTGAYLHASCQKNTVPGFSGTSMVNARFVATLSVKISDEAPPPLRLASLATLGTKPG